MNQAFAESDDIPPKMKRVLLLALMNITQNLKEVGVLDIFYKKHEIYSKNYEKLKTHLDEQIHNCELSEKGSYDNIVEKLDDDKKDRITTYKWDKIFNPEEHFQKTNELMNKIIRANNNYSAKSYAKDRFGINPNNSCRSVVRKLILFSTRINGRRTTGFIENEEEKICKKIESLSTCLSNVRYDLDKIYDYYKTVPTKYSDHFENYEKPADINTIEGI